jgi:hypothetical protein
MSLDLEVQRLTAKWPLGYDPVLPNDAVVEEMKTLNELAMSWVT